MEPASAPVAQGEEDQAITNRSSTEALPSAGQLRSMQEGTDALAEMITPKVTETHVSATETETADDDSNTEGLPDDSAVVGTPALVADQDYTPEQTKIGSVGSGRTPNSSTNSTHRIEHEDIDDPSKPDAGRGRNSVVSANQEAGSKPTAPSTLNIVEDSPELVNSQRNDDVSELHHQRTQLSVLARALRKALSDHSTMSERNIFGDGNNSNVWQTLAKGFHGFETMPEGPLASGVLGAVLEEAIAEQDAFAALLQTAGGAQNVQDEDSSRWIIPSTPERHHFAVDTHQQSSEKLLASNFQSDTAKSSPSTPDDSGSLALSLVEELLDRAIATAAIRKDCRDIFNSLLEAAVCASGARPLPPSRTVTLALAYDTCLEEQAIAVERHIESLNCQLRDSAGMFVNFCSLDFCKMSTGNAELATHTTEFLKRVSDRNSILVVLNAGRSGTVWTAPQYVSEQEIYQDSWSEVMRACFSSATMNGICLLWHMILTMKMQCGGPGCIILACNQKVQPWLRLYQKVMQCEPSHGLMQALQTDSPLQQPQFLAGQISLDAAQSPVDWCNCVQRIEAVCHNQAHKFLLDRELCHSTEAAKALGSFLAKEMAAWFPCLSSTLQEWCKSIPTSVATECQEGKKAVTPNRHSSFSDAMWLQTTDSSAKHCVPKQIGGIISQGVEAFLFSQQSPNDQQSLKLQESDQSVPDLEYNLSTGTGMQVQIIREHVATSSSFFKSHSSLSTWATAPQDFLPRATRDNMESKNCVQVTSSEIIKTLSRKNSSSIFAVEGTAGSGKTASINFAMASASSQASRMPHIFLNLPDEDCRLCDIASYNSDLADADGSVQSQTSVSTSHQRAILGMTHRLVRVITLLADNGYSIPARPLSHADLSEWVSACLHAVAKTRPTVISIDCPEEWSGSFSAMQASPHVAVPLRPKSGGRGGSNQPAWASHFPGLLIILQFRGSSSQRLCRTICGVSCDLGFETAMPTDFDAWKTSVLEFVQNLESGDHEFCETAKLPVMFAKLIKRYISMDWSKAMQTLQMLHSVMLKHPGTAKSNPASGSNSSPGTPIVQVSGAFSGSGDFHDANGKLSTVNKQEYSLGAALQNAVSRWKTDHFDLFESKNKQNQFSGSANSNMKQFRGAEDSDSALFKDENAESASNHDLVEGCIPIVVNALFNMCSLLLGSSEAGNAFLHMIASCSAPVSFTSLLRSTFVGAHRSSREPFFSSSQQSRLVSCLNCLEGTLTFFSGGFVYRASRWWINAVKNRIPALGIIQVNSTLLSTLSICQSSDNFDQDSAKYQLDRQVANLYDGDEQNVIAALDRLHDVRSNPDMNTPGAFNNSSDLLTTCIALCNMGAGTSLSTLLSEPALMTSLLPIQCGLDIMLSLWKKAMHMHSPPLSPIQFLEAHKSRISRQRNLSAVDNIALHILFAHMLRCLDQPLAAADLYSAAAKSAKDCLSAESGVHPTLLLCQTSCLLASHSWQQAWSLLCTSIDDAVAGDRGSESPLAAACVEQMGVCKRLMGDHQTAVLLFQAAIKLKERSVYCRLLSKDLSQLSPNMLPNKPEVCRHIMSMSTALFEVWDSQLLNAVPDVTGEFKRSIGHVGRPIALVCMQLLGTDKGSAVCAQGSYSVGEELLRVVISSLHGFKERNLVVSRGIAQSILGSWLLRSRPSTHAAEAYQMLDESSSTMNIHLGKDHVRSRRTHFAAAAAREKLKEGRSLWLEDTEVRLAMQGLQELSWSFDTRKHDTQ